MEDKMTDRQLQYLNRLNMFIRKLLRLVPKELRDDLENEYDAILQNSIEPNKCDD